MDIRTRVLGVAMLPAALVALLLAVILLDRYSATFEDGLRGRAVAQARQLAATAEFAVFTASREVLQSLAQATQSGDPDILAVSVYDAQGVRLAATGVSALPPGQPLLDRQEQVLASGSALLVKSPIRRTRLSVDDIYSGLDEPARAQIDAGVGQVDGYVVIELSRARHDREWRHQVQALLMVVLAGMGLAAVLALRISRHVTQPIVHMSEVVERIGQGDLDARVVPDPAGAMTTLESGINRMAQRIGYTQDFLLREIDSATAELRERTEEAEQANAAKSRFLAAASHDLRQPLHAMGLFVSRLGQLPLASEAAPLVRQTEASVQVLQDLLDTLLDVSRLDAGLVAPKPMDFSVADLLNRIALEFSGPAREKRLRLRVRPSSLWLHTDPQLLGRVLMNLVSNALRYTESGGVLLGCRRRGDHAVLQVWDTGIGIPENQRQAIFSEYVQLGNPARTHGKGLGLGLAICDRLSQLLELPMGLDSVVGRGSVFWIEVPIAVAGGSETETAGAAPVANLAGTVVVLEDDTLIADGMAGLIGGWGCRVVIGTSADSVAGQCDREHLRPDAIIADYRLGGDQNGLDAALALRRRYGDIPVLLTTGSAELGLATGAAARGFIELTKPVRPGKLRAVLHSMLAENRGAHAVEREASAEVG